MRGTSANSTNPEIPVIDIDEDEDARNGSEDEVAGGAQAKKSKVLETKNRDPATPPLEHVDVKWFNSSKTEWLNFFQKRNGKYHCRLPHRYDEAVVCGVGLMPRASTDSGGPKTHSLKRHIENNHEGFLRWFEAERETRRAAATAASASKARKEKPERGPNKLTNYFQPVDPSTATVKITKDTLITGRVPEIFTRTIITQ